MAKWFGNIGFNSETVETEPGVWVETEVVRPYYGDILRNVRRLDTSDYLNDDLNISNTLSIVADPYALNNFHQMRYAEFMSAKWKITSVEVQYPRLTLTLGGVYTEESQTGASEGS